MAPAINPLRKLQNPWVRGRLARILLKNAGETPAYPAKLEVLQFPLLPFYPQRRIFNLRQTPKIPGSAGVPPASSLKNAGEPPAFPGVFGVCLVLEYEQDKIIEQEGTKRWSTTRKKSNGCRMRKWRRYRVKGLRNRFGMSTKT